jgi:hypothetical protein
MAYDVALRIVGAWSRDQKGNSNTMTKQVGACCSSPASICYWFIVSLVAWGVLSLIGIYWRPLHASSAAACLFAMAIGCLANWRRNRSFHCVITGPLFLIGSFVFLLSGVRMIHVDTRWVWSVLLIGIGIAFLMEWLYGKRPAS